MIVFIDIGFFMESFVICDLELFGLIIDELGCQCDEIELIVFENIVFVVVMEVQGFVMINKYVEGYSGCCYYGGC